MANVIIKSEERRQHEARVLHSFNENGRTASRSEREAAECVAARSHEAMQNLRKMEGKR